MLQHVQQRHHVVALVWKHAEVRQRRLYDGLAQTLAGDPARDRVQFAGFDLAEPAEHRQIVAGTGTKLEDARILGRTDYPCDDPVENPAAGSEPPVLAVERSHLLIDLALHQSSPIVSRTM